MGIDGMCMGRFLSTLLFWLAGSTLAWCQADVMQFATYPPSSIVEKTMGDHAWRIFATGVIDATADKRLAALIADEKIPFHSSLYLHSPGGSLSGGMALGRVIRENKLTTFIGQFDATSKNRFYKESEPGYCYSACATAFLGGEYRYWTNGSVYGVHRFFWNKHSDTDADAAQMISAIVVEYIRSMGVDTKIFALASQAGPSELITPSHEELLELNAVNDGRKPTKWTIESIKEAMYIKGEQETANGTNKFLIVCPTDDTPMAIDVFFDAGQNAEQVMTWPVHWLFLNGQKIGMDKRLLSKTANTDGNINLIYQLDTALLTAISRANTVGIGLQPTTAAVIFSGFDFMPFEGAAAKLPGFLAVCHRGRQ
jgi:hypothetical protein